MHGRGVHLEKSTAAAGKAKSSSVSVKVRGEQMERPLALSVRLPPDPPHTTGTMAPRRQHAGEEERTERRDESGLLPLKEGCVEARVWIVLRGVGKARRENWEGRGATPVLSGVVSVSDSLSVFTLSKSICHRNCGTKREGSLPGRTHLERNGEKTRQPKEVEKGRDESDFAG